MQEELLSAAQTIQVLWLDFLRFIPKLVLAIIFFSIGWLVSQWVEKLILEILKKIKFDSLFQNWKEVLEKAEIKGEISDFLASLVKWVLIISFLIASINILGLSELNLFLDKIVAWLPNIIVAVAIFVVAIVSANYVEKIIVAFLEKVEISFAKLVGKFVRLAILIFAFLAILNQLGIARELVQILFTGIVAFFVISGGLAFGLGGQNLAKDILSEIKNKLSHLDKKN